MKKLIMILLMCILVSGCAINYKTVDVNIKSEVMDQMMAEYNPVLEKGFCMDLDKGVHNIIMGGPAWSEMPLCNRTDIVMHTHPIFGEPWASIIDEMGWTEYTSRYGNTTYGIVGFGWIKFYERR
jgi:hypothetical protein